MARCPSLVQSFKQGNKCENISWNGKKLIRNVENLPTNFYVCCLLTKPTKSKPKWYGCGLYKDLDWFSVKLNQFYESEFFAPSITNDLIEWRHEPVTSSWRHGIFQHTHATRPQKQVKNWAHFPTSYTSCTQNTPVEKIKLPVLKHILALLLWGQKCTETVYQPFKVSTF